MADNYVAQCPHCRTRFRVTRAQLGAAQGAVRCGACLHVFNAARQIAEAARDARIADKPVTSRPATPPTPPTPPAAPARPAPLHAEPRPTPTAPRPAPHQDELRIHDDLDLGDLNLDEELERLEKAEQQQPLQARIPASAAEATPRVPAPPRRPEEEDESWAEALLRDEEQAKAEPPVEPVRATRDEEEEARAEPVADVPGVDLHELVEPPLQLEWQKPRKPWGRWLLWGLLILLALAALVFQYVRHNFEDLARQDQYRPWFERVCPTLGCTLPSRVDISQIRSSNLVVRSHPTYRGALVVDAILYNRASFTQPFPLLELRFADIGGQPVAVRRFKPSEYLSGELAGQRDMPSQTPIHISLEILDPGSQAVNYSLAFHSPE